MWRVRAREAGARDGSGLGLIVSRIIADHKTFVDSESGAATARYIYPSRECDVAERILIVETAHPQTSASGYRFEGYRVEAVADGKSAISYRASAPDLVVRTRRCPT